MRFAKDAGELDSGRASNDLQISLADDDIPEVILPRIVAFFLNILNTQPELRSLLQVARFELPEAEKMIEERVRPIFDALYAYFKRSADSDAIRKIEPELAALGLLGAVSAHQLFREAFTSGRTQRVTPANPADAYVNLWLHGLVRKKTVVVIGAGKAAAMLLRELPRSGYLPVALVDDDPLKAGLRLHGVPVAGTVNELPHVVLQNHPDELMICIPSATGEQMKRIIDVCDETGLLFRTIPGWGDLINGTVTVDQLRDVKFEDLLGRDPVYLNVDSVRRRIADRVVMVTGAAGSIGAELCHQLRNYNPTKLVCVDQAETPLFNLQNAISGSSGDIVYRVADITDSLRMRDIIREHDVRVIFHAAAYKHVPLMEENLQEALKNNVFGLFSLMEIADQSGCEDFLLISSDKAVHPTSFMGCTKRIGELLVAARPSRMRCLCVRFGNVLGSQGSVLPLFQDQIKLKRRVTVTHPDVTRYFMTIPEAVSLLLQAFSIGENGDILVLDMGKPVRILDMAKTLIRLSGVPQDEVEITFSGLRPGEKLSEDLFYGFEQRLNTEAQKVFRTQGHTAPWTKLSHQLAELRTESAAGIDDRIRSKMKEIVPEYRWAPKQEEPRVPAPLLHETLVCRVQVPLASGND